MNRVTPGGGRLIVQKRDQTRAGHRLRAGRAGQFKKGRGKVGQRDKGIFAATGGGNAVGPAHDTGHMIGLAKGGNALEIEAVITTVIAMIGEEDDQRIVRLPGSVKRVKHLAQQLVLHCTIGIVVGNRLTHFVLTQLIPELAALALIDARLVGQRIVVSWWQRKLRRIVHINKFLRHIVGIMGTNRADEETPRLVALSILV